MGDGTDQPPAPTGLAASPPDAASEQRSDRHSVERSGQATAAAGIAGPRTRVVRERGVGAMLLPAIFGGAKRAIVVLLFAAAIVAHIVVVPLFAALAMGWHALRRLFARSI